MGGLHRGVGGYSVTVQDNGSGFSAEPGREGAGTAIMSLRARRCGAQFHLSNHETRGAVVGWSVGLECGEDPESVSVPGGSEGSDCESGVGEGLGMELHDDLCQRLVGVLLELELLLKGIPEKEARLWLQLKEAEERLRRSYQEIRDWSHELIETGRLSQA